MITSRSDSFGKSERNNIEQKHLFSGMIKCKCCSHTFRRQSRKYKNEYVKWICSLRNLNGADTCPNKTAVNENELTEVIVEYLKFLISSEQQVVRFIKDEFKKFTAADSSGGLNEASAESELKKLEEFKGKKNGMFMEGIISLKELKQSLTEIDSDIKTAAERLDKIKKLNNISSNFENIVSEYFGKIKAAVSGGVFTNQILSDIISKIVIDENQNADIYLKIFDNLGMGGGILI